MRKQIANLKARTENLTGNRKRRLERQISWKERIIRKEKCFCDYKLTSCRAQEDGTTPPTKPGKVVKNYVTFKGFLHRWIHQPHPSSIPMLYFFSVKGLFLSKN